ncbi:hypothetical protein [Acinetobacter baumannii]|uniref:hypothetical protein n=1 Tax=Acinetobacter baumannii TaxID=470 RepID=UPI003A985851
METNYSVLTEDIHCDVCDKATLSDHGVLKAELNSNLSDRSKRYEVYLCKTCFLGTLYYLKNQKKLNHLFDEEFDFTQLDNLGLK